MGFGKTLRVVQLEGMCERERERESRRRWTAFMSAKREVGVSAQLNRGVK